MVWQKKTYTNLVIQVTKIRWGNSLQGLWKVKCMHIKSTLMYYDELLSNEAKSWRRILDFSLYYIPHFCWVVHCSSFSAYLVYIALFKLSFSLSRLASLTERKRSCHFVTMKSPAETYHTLGRKSKSTWLPDGQSIVSYTQGDMKWWV